MELEVFHVKRKRLLEMKQKIDECTEEWENIKHDINPLELVFTFIKGGSISKLTPVSRAFFKMIEMLNMVGDFPIDPIRTLHLAESPGGFIQAFNWKRRNSGIIDYSTGWTLHKENCWKKLNEASKSWAYKPILNTGDLLSKEIRSTIISEHKYTKAFFVSGDGGFDFSDDYEKQEITALRLILSQIVVGLSCLDKNGVFILKLFDCFTLPTIQILWALWNSFTGFRIVKLKTSRACNSEKYIIGRGFKGFGENLTAFIKRCETILDTPDDEIVTLFEDGPGRSWESMDPEFKIPFERSIGNMIDTQTSWIHRGINGFKIPRNEKIIMARDWCRKHNIPINTEYFTVHPLLKDWEGNDWPERSQRFSLHHRLSFDS